MTARISVTASNKRDDGLAGASGGACGIIILIIIIIIIIMLILYFLAQAAARKLKEAEEAGPNIFQVPPPHYPHAFDRGQTV
jgi:threonine/homoserine/homoserine lactone efflux protein